MTFGAGVFDVVADLRVFKGLDTLNASLQWSRFMAHYFWTNNRRCQTDSAGPPLNALEPGYPNHFGSSNVELFLRCNVFDIVQSQC